MSIEVMKLALEALDLAKRSHGVMLLSDPPQEAWRVYRVDDAIKKSTTALRQAISEAEGRSIEKAEQQVTSLQCANCQATIESLNDRVMYLMGQAEKSVATNDTSLKRVDETQKQRHETTLQPCRWVGLTYEEIDQCLHPSNDEDQLSDRFWDGVEWAKSQIKEKNK